MTRPLFTDTLRTIRRHFSRFLSILLMVALGTAFFVGMKATAPDMLENARRYFEDYNLMDLRVRSTIGLTDGDLKEIAAVEGVKAVSGEKFTDAFVSVNGAPQLDIDGTRITTRVYAVSPEDLQAFAAGRTDAGYINRFQLTAGRYPRSKGECLVDASRLSTPETYKLGATITLTSAGEQQPEELNVSSFVIVGVMRAPYYLSFERGHTNVGSGKLGTFIVVPDEAFSSTYYGEAYVKVDGTEALDPFSDEYLARTAEIKKQIEYKSPSLIAARVSQTRPELTATITRIRSEIESKQREANSGLQQLSSGIATLQNLVDNGEKLLSDATKEFNDRFSQIEIDISSGQTAYMEAVNNLSAMRAELAANQTAYEQKQLELSENKEAYDAALNKYNASVTQTQTLRKQLESTRQMVTSAEAMADRFGDMQVTSFSNEQIQAFITIMQTTYPDLYNSVSSLTAGGLAREVLANVRPYLAEQKAKLDEQEEELSEAEALLAAQKTLLDQKKTELEQAVVDSSNAKSALDAAAANLDQYAEQLQRQGVNIQSSQLEAAIAKVQAQAQLKELETQIREAPAQLQALLAQKNAIETQLESGLSLARLQLSRAEALYKKLDSVKWELFDRGDTPGYTGYRQTVENLQVISNIFPLFFFLISSLVCLTTVTRLVEEETTLIGTYKALGYGSGPILFKYVFYSLAACVLGSALGIGIAFRFFPMAINAAYSVMYDLPKMAYLFPWKYALIGFAVAMASTALVTLVAALGELKKAPAALMRPKAPKPGKRILLERLPFLWKHLSFSRKVTARNLFRNKNRFFMTLVGIAGCTAMLLGSVGFYNSVSAIKTLQYDAPDAVSAYDLQVVFDLPQPAGGHSAAFNAVVSDARIANAELISLKSVTAGSEEDPTLLETYLLVPEHAENLSSFFRLRDRGSKSPLALSDEGAVVTEKLAAAAGVTAGGTIFFRDAEGAVFGVPVAGIAENYTFHYIFLSPALFTSVTKLQPEYEYALGTISPALKSGAGLDQLKGLLSTDLMNVEGVTTVAYTSETTRGIGEITRALSWVIGIFFVSALVLAVVVLYNLANINIIERTRELATLKVLGFSEPEVGRYILRENVTVSVFGILFGVILGVGLHRLLITFTAIDTVMYGQSIRPWAYVLAVVLTAAIIAGVNALLRRKTRRIDMVESLKSVE